MRILISVVSHNQCDLCALLLASFENFVVSSRHQVSVKFIENSSVPFSVNMPVDSNITFEVLHNLRPRGFGGNHNACFEKFDSDYFLIVNPDILFICPFSLDDLISYMMEHNLDLASPLILNPDMKISDFFRADLSLRNLALRRILGSEPLERDWLAGMFLVAKSSAFRSVGGFDPRYFMYVEDCDLSNAFLRAGFRIGAIETHSVVHDARRHSLRFSKNLLWHISSLIKYWIKYSFSSLKIFTR